MPSIRSLVPAVGGAVAMILVGSSVAIAGELADAPVATGQAVRYLLAWLLLLTFARFTGVRVLRPRGAEWLWLLGVAGTGLILFNVALIQGGRHAEPAVLGVAVACVPLVLALRSGSVRVVGAAVVVTAGALLVEGGGRADASGVAWAVVVFACEAAFTLMAVPVLRRHGAVGVSVHTTWLAAVLFGGFGVTVEGPAAITSLTTPDALALAYLALAVTAAAFVLWYTAVARLGAGRAGLLTGVAPIAAAVSGVLLGGEAPSATVWGGMAVVAAGLAFGLGRTGAPRPGAEPSSTEPVRLTTP